METLNEMIFARYNYWIFVILMMIGLHAMIAKNNFFKKLIGMAIFQSAIILFFISIGVKQNATIPIRLTDAHAESASETLAASGSPQSSADEHSESTESVDPDVYANPLPHVLMLTAIVVGVATLGVGLAISQKIFRQYGTLEESEILERIQSGDG